jgi:metal-sulfur cluster biosynthetic enzyme
MITAATDETTDAVWRALASILDPEFGISIVDLGLIYSVDRRGTDVHVIMTLTTPTCPSGAWICDGARRAVQHLPGVQNVQLDLVFEPQWTPQMLSPKAQIELGWAAEPGS